MMKKLTLRQTYKLCSELWSWLAKHPDKGKASWPKWSKKDYAEVRFSCFACEYDRLQNEIEDKGECYYCPLEELWDTGCLDFESPYWRWDRTTNAKIRKENALIIANFCKNKLKELFDNTGN